MQTLHVFDVPQISFRLHLHLAPVILFQQCAPTDPTDYQPPAKSLTIMRLLNVATRRLEEFVGSHIPLYAILSHTWEPDELTFKHLDDAGRLPHGLENDKINGCCAQALMHKLEYVWIDTICIDKSSSAELSEAINSMYTWYRNAYVCYVFLADVAAGGEPTMTQLREQHPDPDFFRSRWFRRGWTLQELIAPPVVAFYNREWNLIGHTCRLDFITGCASRCLYRSENHADRAILQRAIAKITKVPEPVLVGTLDVHDVSVAARMSWASERQTTRVEDLAYCLLGLFDVNMTMLYGEGPRAFVRLQEEIIRTSDDESVFAWGFNNPLIGQGLREKPTLLASSPSDFRGCGQVAAIHQDPPLMKANLMHYSLTNKGLHIERPMVVLRPPFGTVVIPLCCSVPSGDPGSKSRPHSVLALCMHHKDGEVAQDSRLQVNPSCRVILVQAKDLGLDQGRPIRSLGTRVYLDTGSKGFPTCYSYRPDSWIEIRVQDYFNGGGHGTFPVEIFPSCRLYPTTKRRERLGSSTGFLMQMVLDHGDSDGSRAHPCTVVLLRCPNRAKYILRVDHVRHPDDTGQDGRSWAAGFITCEPDVSLLEYILRTAPSGVFSAPEANMPLASSDGYLRLEARQSTDSFVPYTSWELMIHCGENDQENDQGAS